MFRGALCSGVHCGKGCIVERGALWTGGISYVLYICLIYIICEMWENGTAIFSATVQRIENLLADLKSPCCCKQNPHFWMI